MPAPPAEPVRLDIFADPVCPWCLIGKAGLDQALAARPDHPLAIAWHPFRLNPAMPAEGMDYRSYMIARLGSEQRLAEILDRVTEAARRVGLEIHPERITRARNTLDAHRLMHWAGIEGVQGAVMDGLLRAYWVEGRDIADPAELVAIAREAGMDGAVVARLLAGDADRDTVIARENHARQRGIGAVPSFVLGDTHVISGAQPASFWIDVIDELAGRRA